MYRILPPSLFVGALAAIALAGWLMPSIEFVPSQYRILGVVPVLGGLAITLYSSWLFKRFDTNVNTFGRPDRFVQSGPFRYSRNPMYLGFTLAIFGAAIIADSLPALVLALLFAVIIDRWYIPFEEAMMHDKFEASYERYCARVRRWL